MSTCFNFIVTLRCPLKGLNSVYFGCTHGWFESRCWSLTYSTWMFISLSRIYSAILKKLSYCWVLSSVFWIPTSWVFCPIIPSDMPIMLSFLCFSLFYSFYLFWFFFIENFINVHNIFWSHLFLHPTPPRSINHPLTCSILSSCHLLPLSSITSAQILMGVGPSNRKWFNYQGPHFKENWLSISQKSSTRSLFFLTLPIFPMKNLYWLDFLQPATAAVSSFVQLSCESKRFVSVLLTPGFNKFSCLLQ